MNYNWFSLPVVDESVTVALSGFGNCTLPTSGSLFRVDANHTATQPVRAAHLCVIGVCVHVCMCV